MDKAFNIAAFIAALIALSTIISWSDSHTSELTEWAGRYETCVRNEYNTTPTEYRLEHGSYPECEAK